MTVVIPTRNRWPFLQRAIATALGQQDVELEVVVVDDGSTDETATELKGAGNARLRVLRNEQSRGVASARNRAIADAHGQWIAFLDDDDLWSPGKLRAQLEAAEREQASFVYTAGVVIDERGRVVRRTDPPAPPDIGRRLLQWSYIGGPSTLLVHAGAIERVGAFDERLSVMADWDFSIRLAQTERAACCPAELVAYLKHARNMQVTDVERIPIELELIAGKYRALRSEYGIDVDQLLVWRLVALGHLRAGRRITAARIFFEGAVRYRSLGNLVRAGGAFLGEPTMERVRQIAVRDDRRPPAWLASLEPP